MAMTTADFATPATEAELEALAGRLRERNFEVVIVQDAAEARSEVLKRIPEGASVHSGKSKTLEDAGVFEELMSSDRYDFIRRRTQKTVSRRMSVLAGQHEHRNLSRGPGLEFADGRRLCDQHRPQPGAGGAVQLLRPHRERLSPTSTFILGLALRL